MSIVPFIAIFSYLHVVYCTRSVMCLSMRLSIVKLLSSRDNED